MPLCMGHTKKNHSNHTYYLRFYFFAATAAAAAAMIFCSEQCKQNVLNATFCYMCLYMECNTGAFASR